MKMQNAFTPEELEALQIAILAVNSRLGWSKDPDQTLRDRVWDELDRDTCCLDCSIGTFNDLFDAIVEVSR
jgi:hypothetical protein